MQQKKPTAIDPATAYANAHTRLMIAEEAFAEAQEVVEAAHRALAAARNARAEACRAFDAAETAYEAFTAAQNAAARRILRRPRRNSTAAQSQG